MADLVEQGRPPDVVAGEVLVLRIARDQDSVAIDDRGGDAAAAENIGEQTLLYYGAWDPRNWEGSPPRGGVGIATLPRDRFGALVVEEAGKGPGDYQLPVIQSTFLTSAVPLNPKANTAPRFYVNADGLGALRVSDAEAAEFSTASTLKLTPEQEEGPFYVALEKIRKNITLGKTGVPLHLKIKVVDTHGKVIKGAACDIWQCDAMGIYSDAKDRSFDTRGQRFLRGYQVSDANGQVRFTTIYPGWYPGRAVHIHFKIRTPQGAAGGSEFVSQFYFDEALTDRVHAGEPYATHRGQRLLNARDFIYRGVGGILERELVSSEFRPIPESRINECRANFDIVLGVTPEERPER